jgi:hypothetical protein
MDAELPSSARGASAEVPYIFAATIQVLLADGTARLTTTGVAKRAAVNLTLLNVLFGTVWKHQQLGLDRLRLELMWADVSTCS